MAPTPLLADAYRKYKRGTENLVQWLAETARSTGTVDKVFSNTAIPPLGGRLKGTARKEAKNTPDTYRIATRSFLTLATAIANDDKLSIPASVFTTLRAVIRGRKECASWYATTSDHENDTVKENNASHDHFIKTLESVLSILKAKKPAVKQQQTKTVIAGHLHMDNTYDVLEEIELSGSDDIPEIAEIQAKPTKAKVKYKLKESDTDITFAIYCFLKDVTDLRIAVRRTWREFANGDIGLQAAALTMNVALAMIEKLSNDFEEAYPQFKDLNKAPEFHSMHGAIIAFVDRNRRKVDQHSAFVNARDNHGDSFAYAYKEEKQMLHLDTVLCAHVANLILLTGSDEMKNVDFQISNEEKRFLKCVWQLAAAFKSSSVSMKRLIDTYMVQKAAFAVLYQDRQQSWIMFSLQIFWDMQRELGSHVSVGKIHLNKTGQHIATSYQTYLDVKGLENMDNAYAIQRESVINSKSYVEILIDKNQLQMLFDRAEGTQERQGPKIPGFSLLEHDPAFCGLLLATVCKEHHTAAVSIASNQGQIIAMAHLYNAAQCLGHLPNNLQWADMDWLIEQQGSEWIFMGEKLEHSADIGQRIMLVMGIRVPKFDKDYKLHKSGKDSVSRVSAARRLSFHARYFESACDREPRDKKHRHVEGDAEIRKETLAKLEWLIKDDQMKSKSVCKNVSSLDKLHFFKRVVGEDEITLRFDVMELNVRCIQILLKVYQYARAVAPRDYPPAIFKSDMWLVAAVAHMLYDMGEKKARKDPWIFPVVGIMLRKMIEKEGDSALKGAAALQKSTELNLPGFRSVDEPSFERPIADRIPLQLRTVLPYSLYWQALQKGSLTS